MIPVGYIISITASENNRQVVQTVLKIAGRGQCFLGSTKEAVSIYLFLIRDTKNSKQELATQLKAIPGFSKSAIVALSKPIDGTELSEVRKIFADLDWDTTGVTDDELSLFINDKLLGQYTYYIDLDNKRNKKGPIYMRINRLEDHPQFSPDWLKDSNRIKEEIQGEEQSFDDIEVGEILIETEEKEEPPPPPPPPANLEQMTDIQIRHWIRKNHARILRDEDIEIKRSPEEIRITIKADEGEEIIICKLTT
jgi:hypothetical protein